MSDDWQDAAFSSRHMHNRRGSSNKSAKPFDVRKTFGSYTLKCSAWQKLDGVSTDDDASLELYRLTENGEGVVGQLALPGALTAAVVFAASRASLRRVVDEFEEEEEDDEGGDEDDDDEEEDGPQDRFETFEKNSFRSPKFWFRWSGVPSHSKASKSGSDETYETGLGYIVFVGNDCRKFKATINCSSLSWKDAPITGHKISGRSESDIPVKWGKGKVEM
ncbi:catalase [Paraphoma chrysanthemicola]|uniref:Catalase n=1 Tax=Paraphoma chrysanthemicola TaxID=798071 RepID=A0A8K0QUN2_9PLEO|nr:catalase [Paraphoma chrysanthemicola]